MKIAFFHNLPSGGAKRSAFEWVKRMSRFHKIDLFIYDSTAEDFLDLRPYIRKVVFVEGGDSLPPTWFGRLVSLSRVHRASRAVAHQINLGDYDLAFVMQCKICNSPYVLRYLQKPTLYFCHEPYIKALEAHNTLDDGRTARLKNIIRHWLARLDRSNAQFATLICANSLYSRENIYRAYGVYPRLNYLGVDTEHFCPLNLERERAVLSNGTLCPMKAQDFIIKSMAYIANPPKIRFIFNYGGSGYQSYLVQLAMKAGIEISFERLPSQQSLVDAYNRVLLTVFPSMMEPLGLVPLESLACTTPVVGVAEGGIRETIQHEETGLLTERDPEAFGKAVENLITNQSQRIRMGQVGRERVTQKWTWDQSYQQLEKNMGLAVNHKRVSRSGKMSLRDE